MNAPAGPRSSGKAPEPMSQQSGAGVGEAPGLDPDVPPGELTEGDTGDPAAEPRGVPQPPDEAGPPTHPVPQARDLEQVREAEQAVLGAVFLDADAVERATVFDMVAADDLADGRHRAIWRAMLALRRDGAAIDPITVKTQLDRAGDLVRAGGLEYVAELLDVVPTAANVTYHAELVRDAALERRLLDAAEEIPRRIASAVRRGPALATEIEQMMRGASNGHMGASSPALSAPLGVAELLAIQEVATDYLVEPLIPVDANVLLAGYPKCFKTLLILALAVAVALGQPFLGRFKVPGPRRVGLVLMEDRVHRVRRRLERLAAGYGVTLTDLEGRLFLWPRPALRFADPVAMGRLRSYIEEHALDLLVVDSWAYCATGDSDDADVVTPQLVALSDLRQGVPGLTVGLVHHARKRTGERDGERLTDIIRNSSAFGAWFDVGLLLSRQDERAPVIVRAELRDLPSPEPFAFRVEDEHPPTPETGPAPAGWLRLQLSDQQPEVVERSAAAEKLLPAVREYLSAHPRCSKRKLRSGIEARNSDIEAAFEKLVAAGEAHYEEPPGKGQSGECWLENPTVPHRAPTVPRAHPVDTVPTVPTTPVGGGPGRGPLASGRTLHSGHGSPTSPATRGRLARELREAITGRPELDRDALLAQVSYAAQAAAGPILDKLLRELRPDAHGAPAS